MNRNAVRRVISLAVALTLTLGYFYHQRMQAVATEYAEYIDVSDGSGSLGESWPRLGISVPSLGDSTPSLGTSGPLFALSDDGFYLVNEFAALKDAVEQGTSPVKIRLQGDILMKENIDVPEGMVLYIDGQGNTIDEGPFGGPNGNGYDGQGGHIFLCRAKTDVTLYNASIVGYNYFGTFKSFENKGFTMRYERVDYTGPQLQENQKGTTILKDCTINIVDRYHTSPREGSLGQEVLEVAWVILDGKVEINHLVGSRYIEDAAFWLHGQHWQTGDVGIEVRPGAVVNIVTESAFVHMEDYTSKNLIIGEGAVLDLRAAGVSGTDVSSGDGKLKQHSFTNVEIHENARFSIEQFNNDRKDGVVNNTDYGRSFFLTGSFAMESGSVFEYASEYAKTERAGAGGLVLRNITMKLNNPKLFSVQSPVRAINENSRPLYVTWDIKGINTVNRWSTYTPYASATYNTLDDAPLHIWNAREEGKMEQFDMTITGAAGASVVTPTRTLYSAKDGTTKLDAWGLVIYTVDTKRLAWGNMEFEIDPVNVAAGQITGSIEAGSAYQGDVRASYRDVENTPHTAQVTRQSGPYAIAIPPEHVIAGGEGAVSALANLRGLKVVLATPADGQLLLKEIPGYLDYGSDNTIPTQSTRFRRRNMPDMQVVVQDSRTTKDNWQLLLTLTKPLTSEDESSVLPEALIVRGSGIQGGQAVISNQDLPVYGHRYGANPPAVVEETIAWGPDEGVLVELHSAAGVKTDVEYRATLQWTVAYLPD